MGKVIEEFQSEEMEIDAEYLQHISPARFDLINPYGKFKFDMRNKLNGNSIKSIRSFSCTYHGNDIVIHYRPEQLKNNMNTFIVLSNIEIIV